MKHKHNRPAWWVLDLLVLLMVASLLGVHYLFLSKAGEDLLQVIILLVFYGLIALWLHANSAAIRHNRRRSRDEWTAGHTEDEVNLTETQARYRRAMARHKEKKP